MNDNPIRLIYEKYRMPMLTLNPAIPVAIVASDLWAAICAQIELEDNLLENLELINIERKYMKKQIETLEAALQRAAKEAWFIYSYLTKNAVKEVWIANKIKEWKEPS